MAAFLFCIARAHQLLAFSCQLSELNFEFCHLVQRKGLDLLHDLGVRTLFASAIPPAVRADAGAHTLFAAAPPPAVRADAGAPTLFAAVPLPPVRADAGAPTLFATVPMPAVRAEATATAVSTRVPAALPVLALCSLVRPPRDLLFWPPSSLAR